MKVLAWLDFRVIKLIAWYHNAMQSYHTDAQQKIGAQLQKQSDQLGTVLNENAKLSAVVATGNDIDGMSKPEALAELEQRGELRDVPGVQG